MYNTVLVNFPMIITYIKRFVVFFNINIYFGPEAFHPDTFLALQLKEFGHLCYRGMYSKYSNVQPETFFFVAGDSVSVLEMCA